jgi:PAS domain S-box-containing protein
MQVETRKSGIEVIGNIPWGTHFCQFYRTKKELVDTLVPYFRAGLENNEFCICITTDNLLADDTPKVLSKSVKGFPDYLQKGQFELVPYREWYLKTGSFDSARVLQAWEQKLNQALQKGYAGLRFATNNIWGKKNDWCAVTDYGAAFNNVIGNFKIIALCNYALSGCNTSEIIDVIGNHEFARVKKAGKWDILEHSRSKDIREALIESQEKLVYLASFPALNPMQVIEVDVMGKVRYSNHSTDKLFPDLTLKGTQHPYLSGILELIQTAPPLKSGYLSRQVEVNGKYYEQVIYVFGERKDIRIYGHDVSEHKHAEVLLRETSSYLNSLLDYANAPIIVWDAQFRISRFNPAFERLTGRSSRDVLGLGLEILFPEDKKAESLHQIRRTLSGERWEAVEIPILRVDGEIRTVLWNSANVYDNDGKQIIATIAQGQDITERKLAEDEVKKLNDILRNRAAELEVSNKELEAFSYSVSHDLRAPLRSMQGFSQVLLEDCYDSLNDECKDYLNRIQHASELMAQLIDDMLRLSRITRTEMAFQKVDLSELARVICANLKNQATQRKIVFKIAPGLTAVGDGKLLSLALENLFENAVKFTGNVPAAIIEFGVTQKGGQQVYFISDNGVGFDMTYVNKLFKPFQRLHTISEFPGTGIGLASVQRIIERHGGRVWAEAKVGQGAVFYFTLGGNSGTII